LNWKQTQLYCKIEFHGAWSWAICSPKFSNRAVVELSNMEVIQLCMWEGRRRRSVLPLKKYIQKSFTRTVRPRSWVPCDYFSVHCSGYMKNEHKKMSYTIISRSCEDSDLWWSSACFTILPPE
jgi:hypothetical protein